MRSTAPLLFAVLGLAAAGCSRPVHHAHLADAAGLAEGSPVVVSGVRVGRVAALRVVDRHVDVSFVLEGDHRVTLRSDSCASTVPHEQARALVIEPGTGAPLENDSPVPQCQVGAQMLDDLMQSFGQGLDAVMRSIQDRASQAAASGTPTLPIPLPSAFTQSGACDDLGIRVDGAEAEPGTPDAITVWVTLVNNGTESLELPPVQRLTLVDAAGQRLTPVRRPGAPSSWDRRFALLPGATTRIGIPLAQTEVPQIAAIEIGDVGAGGNPLTRCAVRRDGLDRPPLVTP